MVPHNKTTNSIQYTNRLSKNPPPRPVSQNTYPTQPGDRSGGMKTNRADGDSQPRDHERRKKREGRGGAHRTVVSPSLAATRHLRTITQTICTGPYSGLLNFFNVCCDLIRKRLEPLPPMALWTDTRGYGSLSTLPPLRPTRTHTR